MNISFHKAWRLPASHDERQRLTELRAVCTLEVGWEGAYWNQLGSPLCLLSVLVTHINSLLSVHMCWNCLINFTVLFKL